MRRLIPLLILVTLPALAQVPQAMLTGTARSAKRGVAGVTVTVTSPVLQGSRATTTVANGDYFFDALPPGTYDIQFGKHGYATVTHRGVLMLAQTARVDAELQPSQEEESITATGTTATVLETPEIATTLDSALIERLPIRRFLEERIALAPGDSEFFSFDPFLVDATQLGAERPSSITYVEDSIDQTTVLSGALTPEWGGTVGGSLLTVTKSGGNDFTGSLRDTIVSDVWHARSTFPPGVRSRRLNHMFEGTLGGRIVPDRVWFFVSGGYLSIRTRYFETGQPFIGAGAPIGQPLIPPSPLHDVIAREQAKVTVAPASTATIVASALHESERDDLPLTDVVFHNRAKFEAGSIDATSMAGAHAFAEALAGGSRVGFGGRFGELAQNQLLRAGWLAGSERFGSHELTAGGAHSHDPLLGRDAAAFANDRWHLGTHWSFNIGARFDAVERANVFEPRLAAIFDVHGDGHSRWSLSHDGYVDRTFRPGISVQEDTLAYAVQIGGNGFVRIDGWDRRWVTYALHSHGLEVQGSYRFLGLLEAGGNYTWMKKRYVFEPNLHDRANLWLQFNAPAPHGSLSAAVLEQYVDTAGAAFASSAMTTGIDMTYAVPIARATLFTKGDLMNAFNRRNAVPREFRLGLGARF
jgi:hypothetical protein